MTSSVNRLISLLLVIVLWLLVGVLKNSYAQTYGLKFNGQNVRLDERTELDLSPDGFIKLQDEFEISFDFKTTRISPNNTGLFGYVFRLISDEDKNVDLLCTPTPQVGLNLVIGESNTIIPVEYPTRHINNWIKLRAKFLLAEDRLIFYTPDTFYVYDNVGFRSVEHLKIIFGANSYKQYRNSDVPSMTIKDVQISEKGKLRYHWVLNEKEGSSARDKIRGRKANVVNPVWVTLNHQNWQKVYEHELDGDLSISADIENSNIHMVGEEELTIYSVQRNNFTKVRYIKKPLFFNGNYRTVFNTKDKKIYCYVIDKEPLYSLNTNSGEWGDVGGSSKFETVFRNHNNYYNASDNSIYIFGGYGLHRYNNEIIKIDLNDGTRTEVKTNTHIFPPRYLAGLAVLNDTIYILGGYGSESGDQRINPQSYFDLIGYSIQNKTLFKKFEIPRIIEDMVVGNTFWIEEKTRNFYALIWSKIKSEGKLQLIKGNLDLPEVELVGDQVPFQFLDVRSKVYLFYMPARNQLYACTSYASDSTTKVSIYSIDNPPNRTNFVDGSKKRMTAGTYILILVIILTGTIFFVILLRNRRKKSQKAISEFDSAEHSILEGIDNAPKSDLSNYNIILFGGFQVFNKEQKDITNKFTPLLKELFLLILLHTLRNNKGISSDKITEVLWYDKSEKSARNNRSVNIAKLRTILEEIGDCELSKKTGYWKIIFENSRVKCDYIDFLNNTASNNNLTKQRINHLIKILEKGTLLSNVHYEWLDEFKAIVSDSIIDTLVEFGRSCNVKDEAEFVIDVADSIFNFDIINEEAMFMKCKAQYCLGRHSHAKATYQKFVKEYVAMYGQEYDQDFLDVLELKE